jgi:hypothetical protein
MHMPLTPDANLRRQQMTMNIAINVLDQLLGLDIAHAVDAGNTVTAID